jgi:hypothetical protein
MFYTKLVIQNADSLRDAYLATLNKRWDLVSETPSGGTKAHRLAPAGAWNLHANIDSYNSVASKAQSDLIDYDTVEFFPAGTEYYEGIKVWDSAEVAQEFVAAIQSLNIASVTISYEGTVDPSAV